MRSESDPVDEGDGGDRGYAPLTVREDGDEVRVRDETADREFRLAVDRDGPLRVQSASPDRFVFPVDVARSVAADGLRVQGNAGVFIRDGTGEHLGEVTTTPRELPRGTYYLDVSSEPKAYVLVPDAAFTVYFRRWERSLTAVVEFEERTRVVVGARSRPRRPRATITVPDDPEGLMEGISYLGSSVKEWSAERSWPTLRGHPPALERGDELAVPPAVAKPETGVTVAVPPTHADVYRIAPLAFYLGADVVPGDEPELRLDVGYAEPLVRPGRSLEASVDRLLARCLLLDSLVRIGGYYAFPRCEYEEIAPDLPFYPPNLYDRSIGEQLVEYLEVPFDDLAPFVPDWPLAATLRPDPADAEYLPFLVDSLARIRVRDEGPGPTRTRTRTPESGLGDAAVTATTAGVPSAGETRLTAAAVEHSLDASPAAGMRVRFVGSDAAARQAFDDLVPGDVPVDRTVDAEPTVDDLRRALRADVDFLHLVLPATAEGFACADGTLAFEALSDDAVGATSFALTDAGGAGRGPDSVSNRLTAGLALVSAGAVVGVVGGLADGAAGRLAGHLSSGHSFAVAADLAAFDADHRFVGDPTSTLVDRDGGPQYWADVATVGEGAHRVTINTEATTDRRLGSVTRFIDDFSRDSYQLVGAATDQPLPVSTETLVGLLAEENCTVRFDGQVYSGGHESPADFVREVQRESERDIE